MGSGGLDRGFDSLAPPITMTAAFLRFEQAEGGAHAMDKSNVPFIDIATIMEQFKFPGVDMSTLVESRRKDIEALMQANRIALEGLQAMGERQAEILRDTMEEAQSAMQRLAGSETLGSAAQQNELLQQAFRKALANMQALADIAGKSQAEAFEVITKRVRQ